GGSPRVIVYGYDGLPLRPVAPPSPDYIPGPEEPQTPLVLQDKNEQPVIPPPSTDTTTTGARITVRLQAATSIPPKAEVERLLAMPNLLSSPPLPPPLYIPPPLKFIKVFLETEMPPRKRLCLSTLGSRYEIGESFTAMPTREVGYGIRDTWVDPAEVVPEIAPMNMGEANTRVTELAELHEHDTHDLYALLEDAHNSRTRISQRVTINSLRVNLLMEDRIAHQETILIM
nr:hypothetical protein [Tanacetum cinerariifolium]